MLPLHLSPTTRRESYHVMRKLPELHHYVSIAICLQKIFALHEGKEVNEVVNFYEKVTSKTITFDLKSFGYGEN
eukprot:2383831-Amphidinium_carterae.1